MLPPLKSGTLKCPKDKSALHFEQMHGMRLRHEVIPEKPKRKYYVYYAKCPECNRDYDVKI